MWGIADVSCAGRQVWMRKRTRNVLMICQHSHLLLCRFVMEWDYQIWCSPNSNTMCLFLCFLQVSWRQWLGLPEGGWNIYQPPGRRKDSSWSFCQVNCHSPSRTPISFSHVGGTSALRKGGVTRQLAPMTVQLMHAISSVFVSREIVV